MILWKYIEIKKPFTT